MSRSPDIRDDSTLAYHLRELEIAKDSLHPKHLMPGIQAHHRTILDIGCGVGQTLMAASFDEKVEAYGIDLDAEAIGLGRAMAPSNIHLEVGSGEAIPFPDKMFDLVICRVALPYMQIGRSLAEIGRVLKVDGDVWLSLHGIETLQSRVKASFAERNYSDLAYCCFVGLNSVLLHVAGTQMKVRGRTETVQTEHGIRRAFARGGLKCTEVKHERHFVVFGRKAQVN